jgi:hypothetical protein
MDHLYHRRRGFSITYATLNNNAVGQAPERLPVQDIGPAEVVDDVGGRLPLLRIPPGLGQLVILDHGAVAIPPARGPQVHV